MGIGGLGDIGGGIGGAIGGIAVLAGAGGKGGEEYFKKIVQLWEKIKEPDFDMSTLSAPELAMVAEMDPQTYEARVPEEVKIANDSPELRQAQMAGVQKLQRTMEEGMPIEDRAAAQQSQQAMAQQANRQQGNITENLAARGMMGGGAELQARLGAGQQGAQLAAQQSADLTRQGALRSLQAAEALPGAAGQVRGQDINLKTQQADAINRFNEMRAAMSNQAGQFNAGQRQQAQQYNVGTKQGIANQNVNAQYDTNLANLNRLNALRQQGFGNQVTKAQGLTGAYTGMGNMLEQNKAAREQSIMNIGSGVGRAAGGAAGFFG